MGKGDQVSSKPSSSARAAELLASKTGAAGFGFGGYIGSTRASPNAAGSGSGAADRLSSTASSEPIGSVDAAGGEVPLTFQIDGELAQSLRHLAKKDPTTKTKALKNLRALIPSRSAADLLSAMTPWIYMYNRLILDPSWAVRSQTAATLACLLSALGKAVAPHLRALLGPWFLAMYDTCRDAAEASRRAFTAVFPGAQRQLDAVLFCRAELMQYLKEQMVATPQLKGASPEEVEEYNERVQTACLAALAALIEMVTATPGCTPSTTADGAGSAPAPAAAAQASGRSEVLDAVREILCRPGFWKGTVGAKSAAVRHAAYGLAQCAAQRLGSVLLEGCSAESAACVLGAFGEKEPRNHGAMWEAVLTYSKLCPDGWRHVNLYKVVLPRLLALLRHGCYGSATISLPALLPLLPLLPPGTLGPNPDVLISLLDAVWRGMQDPACATRAAKSASLSTYRECLFWGLKHSARLAATGPKQGAIADGGAIPKHVTVGTAAAAAGKSGGEAAGYCRTLLQGTLVQHVLPCTLVGSGEQAEAAREMVVWLGQALAAASGQPAAGSVPPCYLSDAVGQFLSNALSSRVIAATSADDEDGAAEAEVAHRELAAACEGVKALLLKMRRNAAVFPGLMTHVGEAVAQGLMAPGACPSRMQPAAAQVLALLLREYGSTVAAVPPALTTESLGGGTSDTDAAVVAMVAEPGGDSIGSLNLSSLVAALKAGPLSGPSAEATADLVVAFCTTHPKNPEALWEQAMAAVLPPCADQDATSPNAFSLRNHVEELQCALLLLQRCAAAPVKEAGGEETRSDMCCSGGDDGAHGQKQTSFGWSSASLDALAVRVARGSPQEAFLQRSSAEGDQSIKLAAKLLSVALGANPAGLVMLHPTAAGVVMRSLTEHLVTAAALGPAGRRGNSSLSLQSAAGAAAVVQAALLAVHALRNPLTSSSSSAGECGPCGLWGLLPAEACAALVALARLGWQAPCTPRSVMMGGGSILAGNHQADSKGGFGYQDSHSHNGSDAGGGGNTAIVENVQSACYDIEAADDVDGDGEDEEDEAKPLLRAVQRAAAQFWLENGALGAAAAALPAAQVDQLIRHIGEQLAESGGSRRLSPRAWAAHAAHLLAAAPGGEAQGQIVLDVLLAARPEWRAWSTPAAGGNGYGDGGRSHKPSLEYLARLAEAVGPKTMLGIAGEGPGELESEGLDNDDEEEGADPRKGQGSRQGPSTSGRSWVLVELLCSYHAATTIASAASRSDNEGEEEEEEEGCSERGEEVVEVEQDWATDENGATTATRGGPLRLRRPDPGEETWWRVAGRAAEGMLEYLLQSSVRCEVETGNDAGNGCSGVYGRLLDGLVDGLAEGCRRHGSASVNRGTCAHSAVIHNSTAEDGDLTPTQTVFVEALGQVATCMERTSFSGGRPPGRSLLCHHQRLCRRWLSSCRPGVSAASSGLPVQALLRLLPSVAGPVRRAAAAAAAVESAAAAVAGTQRVGGGSEDILGASGLPDLSCTWMRYCLDGGGGQAVMLQPTEFMATALEFVAACFPVLDVRDDDGSSSRAAAGASSSRPPLVHSAGSGSLAASERLLLAQLMHNVLVRHADMAAARRPRVDAAAAVAAPSSSAQPGADAPRGIPSASEVLAPSPAEVIHASAMRLAHAAISYDWKILGQPELRALLKFVQDHMDEAMAALTECLSNLAAAARTAADGILQQPPGTTPPGPMALQLLRKLSQRGVLGRMAQGQQLLRATQKALEGCGIGAAMQAAVQLAAALMTGLQDKAGGAASGSEAGAAAAAAARSRQYDDWGGACCTGAIQLVIGLCGVECYAEAFGTGVSARVAAWIHRHRAFWTAVACCADQALAPEQERHLGSKATKAAVEAQASTLAEVGLDAVGALLTVVLHPGSGSHFLQPTAYRLLLGDLLLSQMLLVSPAAGTGSSSGAADVEVPEYDGDDVAVLVAGGVRPEMAPWLLPTATAAAAATTTLATGQKDQDAGAGFSVSDNSNDTYVCMYLAAWALVLAHVLGLEGSSRELAVLRQVFRQVEPLVYGLLDRVVLELGLQRRSSQTSRPSRGAGGGASAGDLERWRLAEALSEIGLPSGSQAACLTCRTLFRAVLRSLPATARGWFTDLRDRGLAAAVESYTATSEGPALVAAEIASVQALKTPSGGDGRFSVRASPSSPEVVATLEVEDGAVLELVVKLPACLPLRAPEVECRRKVGVTEARLRKWLLSIASFLRYQNGSVADAISLWKRNIDSEFEGVEACLICYSVFSSVSGQLPRLVCRSCNVRFHPACLYKWFKSAGKSQCPHCQALW